MLETTKWSERRRRSAELAERWPFAAEVLGFYAALLDVQGSIFDATRERRPEPRQVAAFAAEFAVPRVIEVSIDRGPERLGAALIERFHEADIEELIARWLGEGEISIVERYLARAAAGPILEALDQAAVTAATSGPRDERHCPACGGSPQVSYFATSAEDLVTSHRYLECSRCATAWPYTRMVCAACGESETKNLGVYSEVGSLEAEMSGGIVKHLPVPEKPALPAAQLPHLRIDCCNTCKKYLLNVDLSRDGRAVPLVDELAALPLDLYAKELGMTKVTPNLMGF
jgi:formate dehydrogenase maturation protein FdhE